MLDAYAMRRLDALKKEKNTTHCEFCKKPILYPAEADYIKTKRGKEMFFHEDCFKKEIINNALHY